MLTVVPASSGTSLVNLAPGYNINALVSDGLVFTGGGLDAGWRSERQQHCVLR
jgi:hypothetical protein